MLKKTENNNKKGQFYFVDIYPSILFCYGVTLTKNALPITLAQCFPIIFCHAPPIPLRILIFCCYFYWLEQAVCWLVWTLLPPSDRRLVYQLTWIKTIIKSCFSRPPWDFATPSGGNTPHYLRSTALTTAILYVSNDGFLI